MKALLFCFLALSLSCTQPKKQAVSQKEVTPIVDKKRHLTVPFRRSKPYADTNILAKLNKMSPGELAVVNLKSNKSIPLVKFSNEPIGKTRWSDGKLYITNHERLLAHFDLKAFKWVKYDEVIRKLPDSTEGQHDLRYEHFKNITLEKSYPPQMFYQNIEGFHERAKEILKNITLVDINKSLSRFWKIHDHYYVFRSFNKTYFYDAKSNKLIHLRNVIAKHWTGNGFITTRVSQRKTIIGYKEDNSCRNHNGPQGCDPSGHQKPIYKAEYLGFVGSYVDLGLKLKE
jgi:hypothetical protein